MYRQKYLIFCLNSFIVYVFAVRFLDRNVPIMGSIGENSTVLRGIYETVFSIETGRVNSSVSQIMHFVLGFSRILKILLLDSQIQKGREPRRDSSQFNGLLWEEIYLVGFNTLFFL